MFGFVALCALAALAAAAALGLLAMKRRVDAETEASIDALGLRAEYDAIAARLLSGELRLDQAVRMRQVALRAAQIEEELAALPRLPVRGQVVRIEPRTDVERDACARLVASGILTASVDGAAFEPSPTRPRESERR